MIKNSQDQPSTGSANNRRRLVALLLMFCAASLIVGGILIITGATRSQQASGNQEQQNRPRVVQNQNQNQKNANIGAAGNQNKSPVANENKSSTANEKRDSRAAPTSYYSALDELGVKIEGICSHDDPVARRILEDYGAIFIASESVVPPPVCMFASEAEVSKFQHDAKFVSANLGGTRIELQPAAMEALLAARQEANAQGLDITPRGGAEAARRSFADTVRLWNSRFLPALTYWSGRGRLSREQVARLRKLSIHDQVAEVLQLEKSGIFFSTDFSKSILYSVAAPGASQHISMLALDVSQFGNSRVRRILAQHGWFQTVKSDMPHFTYLGLKEEDLRARGLRSISVGSQLFWIPNVSSDKE